MVADKILFEGPQLPAGLKKKFSEQSQPTTTNQSTESTAEASSIKPDEPSGSAATAESTAVGLASAGLADESLAAESDIGAVSGNAADSGLTTVTDVAASASLVAKTGVIAKEDIATGSDITANAGLSTGSSVAAGVGLGLVGYDSEDDEELPENIEVPESVALSSVKPGETVKSLVAYDDSYTADNDGHPEGMLSK